MAHLDTSGTPPSEMTGNLKLSEAAKLCGISARTLKVLIADNLLPQAIRTPQGHALLPSDSIPTWQECRALVEQQRDRQLQRAEQLLNRVKVELEAISNDLSEAREHPTQPLGVDLLSSGRYFHSGQTSISNAMLQFDLARMEAERYHAALQEIMTKDKP
ncbi:MAG: DNA-binding protein [Mycobacterium sp.]|nr:MAG: DNA-binding protein [Mycobacterium sp.]